MKKLAGILLVTCAVLFFAGQASAALWTEGNLYMVQYEKSGAVEFAVDLGDLTPYIAAGEVLLPTHYTTATDNMVAFFALEGAEQYFATTQPIAPGTNASNFFKNAFNSTIKNYYFGLDGDDDGVAQGLKADAGSYFSKFNSSNPLNAGSYAALNSGYPPPLGLEGEEDLSDGYSTMYLYETTQIAFPPDNVINPQYVCEINPVPVPGAFLLLASGLLGLVGIKRKYA